MLTALHNNTILHLQSIGKRITCTASDWDVTRVVHVTLRGKEDPEKHHFVSYVCARAATRLQKV